MEEVNIENPPKRRLCKICKRKLKRFSAQKDWAERAYHKNCFDSIMGDIVHYNTRAYSKYGHQKRMLDGTLLEERKKSKEPITLTFD